MQVTLLLSWQNQFPVDTEQITCIDDYKEKVSDNYNKY